MVERSDAINGARLQSRKLVVERDNVPQLGARGVEARAAELWNPGLNPQACQVLNEHRSDRHYKHDAQELLWLPLNYRYLKTAFMSNSIRRGLTPREL